MTRRRPQDSPRDWYQMKASTSDGPAEVLIYDEIGWFGVTATNFSNDLKAIDSDAITVRLNSPGGDVYDGLAILNALRSHKAKITTVVDGIAASAASFIAMAGDEIVMNRNSEMMIHDAWGMSIGNADDLTKAATDLNRMSDNIASIYAEKAGGTTEEWREVMRAETWYSAQEAVDAGLADRVATKPAASTEDEKPSARFDLSVFNYAGRHAAPAPLRLNRVESGPGSPVATPTPATPAGSTQEGGSTVALTLTDEQETSIREALGLAEDADADAIVTAIEELATTPEPEGGEQEPSASTVSKAAASLGMAAIDSGRLATLEANNAKFEEFLENQRKADIDARLNSAITEGRITPANKEKWRAQFDANPASAADLLNSMAPNTAIPVAELGHSTEPADTSDVRESVTYKNWSI